MTIRSATTLLCISVLALLSVGIVMLASTSSVRATALMHDPSYYLKRQLVWLVLALIAAYVAARIDYRWWRKLAVPLFIGALIMLVLVFVPGIGVKVGGSHRWLGFGPLRLQPSEAAKIVLVVMLAAWMTRVERRAADFKLGLLMPVGLLGLTLGLLFIEPDFGTTMLMAAVGVVLLFAGGTRPTYLVVFGVTFLCLFFLAVLNDPHRLGRVMAFMYPEKYPDAAYHLMQSKVAFIKGGLFGVGLGNSIQKQFYLPEAHTDFILAIIGEELGLIATGLVVLGFLFILICGLSISMRAPDTFGRLLGFGITATIAMQAAINVGVVTGCLPTKGLALPFISYGGSSLLGSMTSVGILISIANKSAEHPDEVSRSVKNRSHRF